MDNEEESSDRRERDAQLAYESLWNHLDQLSGKALMQFWNNQWYKEYGEGPYRKDNKEEF